MRNFAMCLPMFAAGDLASAMATAPVKGATVTQAIKDKPKGNPIAALLGAPKFRANTNIRVYKDKQNPDTKTSSQLAKADFDLPGSGVTITANVYMERELRQGSDGRKWRRALRFSLPKGIGLPESVDKHVEGWKLEMLGAFQKWQTETGTSLNPKSNAPGTVALPDEDESTEDE